MRLREYMDFGSGKPLGHWGGRYVWQLDGSSDLVVAWKKTPGAVPREAEIELLSRFRQTFGGRLPFANIAD
jgi:hypothetical protein